MNVVDFYKDRERHNVTEEASLSGRPQPPQRSTTADAGLPVPAPLVAHASSSDNIKGFIPRSPGLKGLGETLGQSHHKDSSLNFVQPAPTHLPTGITHSFQPASESESGTTDDEYHVLNKDDIPKVPTDFDQKPGGWPKQASNVRWISEDQQPLLVPSGLVTAPPIGAYPKPSTQPSPFARFLSRPAKERKQPQAIDQIPELEDDPKPLQNEAQVRTVLGQFGGPIAVLGLGSMYSS